MPRKACTRCARPAQPGTNRCAQHGGNHTGWSPDRDRQAQHHLRQALLARAGERCEWVDAGGRCIETTDLRACHVTSLEDGGDYAPSNGILLCRKHDRLSDRHAR